MFKDTPIFHRLKAIAKLKERQLFKIVFDDKRAKDLIIDLNTQKQLKERGINSMGQLLSSVGGKYSPVTIGISQAKGQPKKSEYIIDLHDTGEFYRSFRVIVSQGQIEITADTIKDDDDLIQDWGEDILGLTENNLQILQDFAILAYQKEVRKRILI